MGQYMADVWVVSQARNGFLKEISLRHVDNINHPLFCAKIDDAMCFGREDQAAKMVELLESVLPLYTYGVVKKSPVGGT